MPEEAGRFVVFSTDIGLSSPYGYVFVKRLLYFTERHGDSGASVEQWYPRPLAGAETGISAKGLVGCGRKTQTGWRDELASTLYKVISTRWDGNNK
jgi:hypothetical protein